MKCPNCKNRILSINFNFRGMTSGVVKECICGHIWYIREEEIIILSQGEKKSNK